MKRLDVFVCEATHILATKNNGATFGFVLFSFSDKMEKQSMMCALAFQHIKQGEEQKIVSIKRLIVSSEKEVSKSLLLVKLFFINISNNDKKMKKKFET